MRAIRCVLPQKKYKSDIDRYGSSNLVERLGSNWVVGELEQVGGGLAALDPRDLLEEGSVHASLLRVHHTTEFVLLLGFDSGALASSDGRRGTGYRLADDTHLVSEVLLVGHHLLFFGLVSSLLNLSLFVGAFDPPVHVGAVGAGVVLELHLLLAHLRCQHFVQLLVLLTLLVLFVDVLQRCLFVLVDALLDVLFLLLKLQLLIIVLYDVAHSVHNGLDALATGSHLTLASLLLLEGQAHVSLDLLCIVFLHRLHFGHLLLLLADVFLDDFHCSVTLASFLINFASLLLFDVLGEFGDAVLLFFLVANEVLNLLGLRLLEHDVPHPLLLNHLLVKFLLLLVLNFKLFLGLVKDLAVEVLLFLNGLVSEFGSHFDLLVEDVAHLPHFATVVGFLLALLFLVELLPKLLDLAPLVVADVRRHVLYHCHLNAAGELAELFDALGTDRSNRGIPVIDRFALVTVK